MKLHLPALLAAVLLFSPGAQAQCGTRNTQAFLRVIFPGTIPVDDSGQPLRQGPDSTYTVYLESASKNVADGYAWVNGKAYAAHPFRQDAAEVIGKAKRSGEPVRINAATGNYAQWRIELTPLRSKMKAPAKAGANQVLLQLKMAGKKCTQTIRRITELSVPPSV
ncbi:MAG: hypothetical protein EOO16_02735 [Chitinophagaceae bacterium]|nr:MAG: hypothetical protein EOO16_02735 [Chitinophagaceae bacterium]